MVTTQLISPVTKKGPLQPLKQGHHGVLFLFALKYGDFSPNLYTVSYNIPVLRALITNFKRENLQDLCSGKVLGVIWKADKM